jgi:branched-chain amino acid transport system ATP-binding protein
VPGLAPILVEQKLTTAMRISRRLTIVGHGRIVFDGTPADIEANTDVCRERLEV